MKRLILLAWGLMALPLLAGATVIVNPADFGFDPSADPATNAAALQKALDGGDRCVRVTKPGVYGLDRTVFLDSHTELECVPGVVLQKRAKYANILVNRGAYCYGSNEDITVRGLEISVNGFQMVPPPESPAKNLRGQLAFYGVRNIRVFDFRCVDLGNYQYCVHFVDFDNILVDGFEIRGRKDAVHLNCGRNFVIRNGVMAVEDDGIAINAGEWPDCTPKIGSLENGLVEKIVFELTEGEGLNRKGEVGRLITGSWPDWHPGIMLQRCDILRAGQNVYGVFPMPFVTNEIASLTMPTHTHGVWKSPEGINFCFLQSNAVTRAEIRNVVFRDVVNHHPYGFLVQWENGSAWSRLVHTEVPPEDYPVIDATFERVRSTYPNQPLVRGGAPCDLKFRDVWSAGRIVQMGAARNTGGRLMRGISRRISCTDSTFDGPPRLDFWFFHDADNVLLLGNNREIRPVGIEARPETRLAVVRDTAKPATAGVVTRAVWRNESALFFLAAAKELSVESVSALRTMDGETIPSAAVRTFVSDEPVPTEATADGKSLWLMVAVPRETKSGIYRGTATYVADGKLLRKDVELSVRGDVLPDPQAWQADLTSNAWMNAFAAANGLSGDVLAAAKARADGFSPRRELVRGAVADFVKIGLLESQGRTQWQVARLYMRQKEGANAPKTAANWREDLADLAAVADEISLMGELNGRKVESAIVPWGREVGYETPQAFVEILQHPVKAMDVPGRPLYVVLHSSGHNAALAINCTRTPGNHDIYRAPDDFFALYLDCMDVERKDWWWGSKTTTGFALSPCEKRLLATIERTVVKYGIDRDRIYLCGNSMGGSGTLGFGLRHGDIFAAIKANVPALVDHVCDRMGWKSSQIPAGMTLPDPPILVDYSSPLDKKWSFGHERLVEMMRERKYAFYFYWGAFGHANSDPKMLEKNDLIHSFDWIGVKKSDIYPVFTEATSDTPSAWPLAEPPAETPGQFNAFFRWREATDSTDGAQVTLYLADLKSKHFATPASATATVTLRRLRNLKAKPGDRFDWTYGEHKGELTVGEDGLLSVPGLETVRDPRTLVFTRK